MSIKNEKYPSLQSQFSGIFHDITLAKIENQLDDNKVWLCFSSTLLTLTSIYTILNKGPLQGKILISLSLTASLFLKMERTKTLCELAAHKTLLNKTQEPLSNETRELILMS